MDRQATDVLDSAYFAYWGKTAVTDGNSACHLLAFHALDVAAVGQALLACRPRLGQCLAYLTGLDEKLFTRWLVFFLALHDLGKFSDSFQQLAPDTLVQLGRQPRQRDYSLRHDTLGYHIWREIVRPLLIEQGTIPAAQERRGQLPGGAGLDQCLRAVTGHHGQPPMATEIILRDHLDSRRDADAVRAYVTDLHTLLLGGETLPVLDAHRMKHAAWWLAGFTVLCDWLGSSRDPEDFLSQPQSLGTYWRMALPWAEAQVRQAGLMPSEPAARFGLADCLANGNTVCPQPTPLQAQAADLPLGEGPQLFLLEDVTGAGKTEAALLLAQRLMAAGRATGIYFGLPTMATSNAMYERLRSIYRRLYTQDSEPSLVLAHSASRLSGSFMNSLASSAPAAYGDGTVSADAHCNAWLADNRKKALLAEVGVGTIDQALLGILPARHQSLRLLGLLDKILLVDEVHACDAYMHNLLCDLLRAHASAGGSAILLSATLPQDQRRAL
ncbi:MAG: CRISPR-associated endonuclease Cas3'', partial [Candidatus Binatia bacterium]